MNEDRLRLRLAVRRHGLPEVRVLFNAAVESEPTISKLLEQIDEVIPLESDDWGLEDYVVELRGPDGRGFECMHFEPVTKILQKDEEILIRPIFTEDRKKRRMSGREQISEDGKHLIDGIPFGRMRRKTPRDRPVINIPPLKKRRITYDAPDADSDSPDESQPLLITEHGELEDPASVVVSAAFEDADDEDDQDDDEDEEEEGDGDFQDDEWDDPDQDALDIDEDELQEELRGLRADNASLDLNSPAPDEPTGGQEGQPTGDQSFNLGLEGLDNLTALRGAFPSASLEACERMLLRCNNNLGKAYRKLRASFDAGKSLEEMLSHKESLAGHSGSQQGEDSALQSEDSEAESVDSLTKHYDDNGFPSGSIDEGTASLHMAESLRQAGQDVKLPTHTVFTDETHVTRETGSSAESDDSSSDVSSSSSDSDSDADSSSGSEGESDSDDEFDPEGQPSTRQAATSDSEADSSSSESDSDDAPEVASSKQQPRDSRGARAADQVGSSSGESESESNDDANSSDTSDASSGDAEDISSDSSSDEDSDDSDSSSDSSSGDDSKMSLDKKSATAPTATKSLEATKTLATPKTGQQTDGKDATTSPAARTTAPGNGLTATQKRNARRKAAKAAARESLGASQASTPARGEEADHAVAARKAALLKSLETDETGPALVATEAAVSNTLETTTEENGPSEMPPAPSNVDSPKDPQPEPAAQESPAATPTQRRSRLDLGAGRRMLFASLGLRNPKTKADEDKIRANLMKDVRPPVNPRISEAQAAPPPEPAPTATEEVQEEDPDAWREKIIYRAVECCQEGVELSEPPFPFVQRWDPQQQYNAQDRRGNRRKRKQRDNGYAEDETERHITKRRRSADNGYWGPAEDDIVLNYDDEPTEDVVLATQDASPYAHIPEPPPLPANTASLAELNVDRAFGGKGITGMAITWQQLLLSQETNWQPEVRTFSGTIVDADKTAQSLGIVLAKRDRAPEPQKEYDEQGNRIYGKFEVPDMDDEEDGGDEAAWGYQQIGFFELMQPRILKQPPVSLEAATEDTTVQDIVAEGAATEATSLPLAADVAASSAAQEDSPAPGTSHSVDGLGTTNLESDESVVHDTYPIRTLADHSSSQLSPFGQTAGLHGHDHTAEIIVDSNSREEGASLSDGPEPKLDSPSQQLEDMSEAAALASQRSSLAPSIPQPILVGSDRAARPALPAVEEQDAAPPVLNGGSTPTRPTSAELPPAVGPEVDDIQSPPSSIPPGRQRDPGFSPELGEDSLAMLGDSAEVPGSPVLDAANPSPQLQAELTPTRQKALDPKLDSSPSSDASLPSLSEIWATAASSGNTQTPDKSAVMSAVQARNSGVLRDLEYEEAMRRLDDGDLDSDAGSQPSGPGSKRQDAVKAEEASSQLSRAPEPQEKPNGTGRKGKTRAAKAELESSPPLSTISRKRKAPPAGSQVISLVSSSPEPNAGEFDADDSKDESYDDDASAALGGRRRGKKRGAKSGFSARRVASLFSPIPAPKSGGSGNSKRRVSSRS